MFGSSPKRKSNSPHKENESPLLKKCENLDTLQESKKDLQEIKLINKRSSNITNNEVNQLKIKLSDYEFELKKVTEDFAEYKLLSKMDKQKSIKKLKQQIQENKKRFHQQNLNWERRFAKRLVEYQEEVKHLSEMLKSKYEQEKQSELHQLQQKVKLSEEKYSKDILQMKIQLKTLHQRLAKEYESKSNLIQQSHLEQIQSLRHKSIEIVKKTEQKYQTKIVVIETQKKAEIQKQQQVKKQASSSKQKYINEIYYLRRDKKLLEQTIEKLEMTIKVLNKRAEDKNAQIDQIKLGHESAFKNLEEAHAIQLKNVSKKWDNQKMDLMKQHYSKLELFQLKIQRNQEIKEKMESHYEQLFKAIKKIFNERQSKVEDVEKIKKLEGIIILKEKEIINFQNYLKMNQLQRQNNEKNYTRIFTAHGSREKRINHSTRQNYKDHTEFRTILKQSNTTDLKYLLKICQKQF